VRKSLEAIGVTGWKSKLLGVLILAAVVAGVAHLLTSRHDAPAMRVLFIGNSFTYYNGGIDQQLQGLDPSIATQTECVGGYTLADHLSAGAALEKIRRGGWSYVVLQEQSQTPALSPQSFAQSARAFDQAIRSVKAKTVLLMTWERPDSVQMGVTTASLSEACRQVGSQLNAIVAPVGEAFAASLAQRPSLALTAPDGHPTPAGTYLAACVLYGRITRHSPVGDSFGPDNADERDYLQRIAAETLGY